MLPSPLFIGKNIAVEEPLIWRRKGRRPGKNQAALSQRRKIRKTTLRRE